MNRMGTRTRCQRRFRGKRADAPVRWDTRSMRRAGRRSFSPPPAAASPAQSRARSPTKTASSWPVTRAVSRPCAPTLRRRCSGAPAHGTPCSAIATTAVDPSNRTSGRGPSDDLASPLAASERAIVSSPPRSGPLSEGRGWTHPQGLPPSCPSKHEMAQAAARITPDVVLWKAGLGSGSPRQSHRSVG